MLPDCPRPHAAALLGIAAGLLDAYTRGEEERQTRAVIERFGLDPSNPAAAAAALAFRWVQARRPWLFDTPQTGPEMQAMAERVMRAVQADPTLLGRVMAGDAASVASLKAVAQGAAMPGSGIETRNDEERSLVAQMMSRAEIQAALDGLQIWGGTSSAPVASKLPGQRLDVQDLAPGSLRFSQRTAGGNGGAVYRRQHVRENNRIVEVIDAVRTPVGVVTMDNTRVAVAREHGLASIPVRAWEQDDPLPAEMR